MKKAVVMLLVFALLAGVFGLAPIRAAGEVVIQMTIGSTKAYVNSKEVILDQPPVIENSRTLVPFRFIGEALGAKIGWDPVKKTVSYVLGNMNIVLTIGSTTAFVNSVATKLDVAPKILSGRTVVPVRFISETIGAKVDWNSSTKMVTITVSAKVAKAYNIVMIVKNSGNPFFEAAQKGGQEAATKFGDKLIFQAPEAATAEGQISIIEALIAQKVDGILISANDKDALVPACKKALGAGIKVICWDSAIAKEGTLLYVNQADPEQIGRIEVQFLGKQLNYEGDIAILSATAEATNQNIWIGWMKEELKDPKYAKMKLVATVYGNDEREKSYDEALGLFKTYPNLKGIISPTTVGIAATARALEDQKLNGKIALTGLGLPSEMKEYVLDGTCKGMFLWNPVDLGYLATYATHLLISGELKGNVGEQFTAGRMGDRKIVSDATFGPTVFLGPPFEFNKDNIEEWAKVY